MAPLLSGDASAHFWEFEALIVFLLALMLYGFHRVFSRDRSSKS